MIRMDRQRTLNAACEALAAALPHAWAIYVYGSFARGEESASSDLDVAVLQPPTEAIADRLDLISAVSRATKREVDLVDLRTANLDLVYQLLREGKPLLVRNKDDVLAWEAERMTDYALFNQRRREILSGYLNEPLQ